MPRTSNGKGVIKAQCNELPRDYLLELRDNKLIIDISI